MPLSDTLGKIANGKKKDKELMSYEEWAASQPDEAGLEEADWFPGESLLPSGMMRKAVKKGGKAAGKIARDKIFKKDNPLDKTSMGKDSSALDYKKINPKPDDKDAPIINYQKLGKTTEEKRAVPNWKKKQRNK